MRNAGSPADRPPAEPAPTDHNNLPQIAHALIGRERDVADRAAAALGRFSLTDETAPVVAEVCRRLNGIPLAIELAAPRLKVLKPEVLLARLDDQLHLLTAGSRMAVPRQQTLRAAIEWSDALLSEAEQAMLRRLGVFAGSFTLEAVAAVATGAPVEESDVFDVLAGLVDKSLVVSLASVGENRYRLLESTRAFALEKLATCRYAAGASVVDELFDRQTTDTDVPKRETILHRMQQLMYEYAIYAPIWQLGFLSGQGSRVEELGLGLIAGYPYSAPYEAVRLKTGA